MPGFAHRIQLRDFRLILAISETGQLARAAKKLSISQPAASRMLANIEQMIGAPVFIRHPKGMVATPIGDVLTRNATNLLRSFEKTIQETGAAIAGRAGNVRVGAVTGAAVGFVVPAVQELKKTTAAANIHVEVAPSDELVSGLLRGDFDFVLSRIPPGIDARDLVIQPGSMEVVHFLTRQGHPLAEGGALEARDLARFEWVIQPQHTPLRQAVEDAFVARGIPSPPEVVNTTSLLVMISYLASTDAIAPVASEVAALVASGGVGGFAVLKPEKPVVIDNYYVLSLKSQVMSAIASRLRDLVMARLEAQKHAES